MRKPSGEGKSFVWRYTREHEVLYVEAHHHTAGGEYLLTWRYPDGTSRSIRLLNLALIYDALHGMEEQLGREGWQLLPPDLRAPNRLLTPSCRACQTDRQVETSTRTPTHVQFRCTGCGYVWIVPKPGVVSSSR